MEKNHITHYTQQNEIPEVKKNFTEYKNIHSLVLQDVSGRQDKAFDNFYRRISERKKISLLKKLKHIWRGTPGYTPVKIGLMPERANPGIETGSSLR